MRVSRPPMATTPPGDPADWRKPRLPGPRERQSAFIDHHLVGPWTAAQPTFAACSDGIAVRPRRARPLHGATLPDRRLVPPLAPPGTAHRRSSVSTVATSPAASPRPGGGPPDRIPRQHGVAARSSISSRSTCGTAAGPSSPDTRIRCDSCRPGPVGAADLCGDLTHDPAAHRHHRQHRRATARALLARGALPRAGVVIKAYPGPTRGRVELNGYDIRTVGGQARARQRRPALLVMPNGEFQERAEVAFTRTVKEAGPA